jgi:hypothetical protein
MSEKVLFEMRVSADGHVEVTESPEWRAYHARRGCAPLGWLRDRLPSEPRTRRTPDHHAAHELRRALDSLQGIYDDLYGRRARADT